MNIKIYPSKAEREIKAPPSKSYTNRALILAALTDKSVTIRNPLDSDDTKAMIECLKKLGISIESGQKTITVKGSISSVNKNTYELNAKLSGTTIRFLLALVCIVPGVKILRGEKGLNKRPIGDLVEALKQLGAKIEYLKKEGYPPVKITSSQLASSHITLSGKISSQFLSAILMIAPVIGGLAVEISDNLISKPYIDMTIDIMGKFGVRVKNNNYKHYKIGPNQKYDLVEYSVEGDYSSAAYFFAIAALTESSLTIQNLNPDSKQADKQFLDILEKMGNKINRDNQKVTIEGNGVHPIDVNMENCPDQAMTLAVIAAFGNGKTKISGLQSLKVKETDRLSAAALELAKMDIKTDVYDDSLIVYGGSPKAADIDTYDDHRIAMSFAVAGTKIDGMIIKNAEVVNKTFPNFWKALNTLGVKTETL